MKLVISQYKTGPGACSSLLQMTKNENILLIMYYSVRARLSVSQARCGTGSHSSCELQVLLYKAQFTPWGRNDSRSSCLLPPKKSWIPSNCNDFGKERASPSVNFLSGLPKGRWHFFFPFIFTEQVVQRFFILFENLEQATFRKMQFSSHFFFTFSRLLS